LEFPAGWSFTTHKDLLLPRQLNAAASFLAPSPSSSFFSGAVAGERRRIISLINLAPVFSGAVAGEEEKTSARGVFRTHILYFVIVLLYFIYFTCIALCQKPKKKLESLVIVFTLL
jgi:hypothetical protein